MKNTSNVTLSSRGLTKNEGKSTKTLNLGSGITVIVNDVRRAGEDLFDEIAAAIVAIKMYLSSKKKSRRNVKNEYRNITNGRKDGKVSLWFKSWLGEAMKEFECNPYRHDYFKNKLLSWP